MGSLQRLVREDLQGFRGYSSAAKESADAKPAIKVDANESPWPPFGPVAKLCEPHRYPEPQPTELRQRLAGLWGVDVDEILVTSGSDQSIDVLLRTFCMSMRDGIVVCPPTFAMYEVYAKLQGASVARVPLTQQGQPNVDDIINAVEEYIKIVFLPSPVAPLGNLLNVDLIRQLADRLHGRCAIVIDEAYVSFSSTPQGALALRNEYDNILILRTLSKAHALAGERIGCTIAPPDVIAVLRGIVPPYPVSQSAIRAAIDALSPVGLVESELRWRINASERSRLTAELPKADGVVRVWPSEANFLFIETEDAAALMTRLTRYGIQARNLSSAVSNAVRLSIGSPEENDAILRALGIHVERHTRSIRAANVKRETLETVIDVAIALPTITTDDAFANDTPTRRVDVATGIGFLDHMLCQVASHGDFSLTIRALGDRHIDDHHTIEDTAIAFGEALRSALGEKIGIARFGFYAPLDEALAHVVIDLSGRPHSEIAISSTHAPSDGIGLDLVEHFFRSFATSLRATLHISAHGDNTHHVIEACFKGLGRALRQAVREEGDNVPSTKGVL